MSYTIYDVSPDQINEGKTIKALSVVVKAFVIKKVLHKRW